MLLAVARAVSAQAAPALAAVTARVYDEDAGDMVTGGEDGRVALWAVGGR